MLGDVRAAPIFRWLDDGVAGACVASSCSVMIDSVGGRRKAAHVQLNPLQLELRPPENLDNPCKPYLKHDSVSGETSGRPLGVSLT